MSEVTLDDVQRYIDAAMHHQPPSLPSNLSPDELWARQKLIVGGDLDLSPQALAYIQSKIAFPASGATVATTVSGLGTGTDGKLGLIRAGSTPYDFLAVTYDATYGKWVSAAQSDYLWATTNAGVTQTDVIALAELAPANQPPYGPLLYKVFKNAGLTMQGRLTVFAVSASTKTANFRLGHRTWNTGSNTSGSTSFHPTVTTLAAGGSTSFMDTGWLDLSPTNNDFIGFTMGAYRASGGTGISITFSAPRIHWRWVG